MSGSAGVCGNDFPERLDLASERMGGVALAANDEFFAPKESLLKAEAPVFREHEYTDRGKWMDGWETRRRREPGHDWCVIRLGAAGLVEGVVVDTRHFRGNAPEACSVEACEADERAGPASLQREAWFESAAWFELVPKSSLQADAANPFPVAGARRATHVRLNIYPDGGVARLRVHGVPRPDWERLTREGAEVDLAAAVHGGLVVASSDVFFGSGHNLILPGSPRDMRDGWETRRRRGPGHDWTIVRLARAGIIRRASVDTTYFKGNAPGSCSIDICDAPEASAVEVAGDGIHWRELLPRTPLRPDTVHAFEAEVRAGGPATHARLNIHPDGGVARLRLFGAIPPGGA